MILEVVSTREATAEECDGGGHVNTYNHTWQEVHDAVLQGTTVLLQINDAGIGYTVVHTVVFSTITNQYLVDPGELIASAPTDMLETIGCEIL